MSWFDMCRWHQTNAPTVHQIHGRTAVLTLTALPTPRSINSMSNACWEAGSFGAVIMVLTNIMAAICGASLFPSQHQNPPQMRAPARHNNATATGPHLCLGIIALQNGDNEPKSRFQALHQLVVLHGIFDEPAPHTNVPSENNKPTIARQITTAAPAHQNPSSET